MDSNVQFRANRQQFVVSSELGPIYRRTVIRAVAGLGEPIELSGGVRSAVTHRPDQATSHQGRAVGGASASRNRRFESVPLQRGVYCEPHFRGAFHRRTEGRNPSPSKLLRQRTRRWHPDEMVVPIARKRMYLSRAVDHEGEILDISAHYHSLIAVRAAISKVPTRAHLPAVYAKAAMRTKARKLERKTRAAELDMEIMRAPGG